MSHDPQLIEQAAEARRQHQDTGSTRRLTEMLCTCGVWTEDPERHQAEAVLDAVAPAIREATLHEALAVVKRASDGECKSPGTHTGCAHHEAYRVLRDMTAQQGEEQDRG